MCHLDELGVGEPGRALVQLLLGEGGSATADAAQGRQVELEHLVALDEEQEDGGHERERRDAVLVDGLQHLQEVEPGQHHGGDAARDAADADQQAEDVEHGDEVQHHLVEPPVHLRRSHHRAHGHHVAMRQHHALALPRRP